MIVLVNMGDLVDMRSVGAMGVLLRFPWISAQVGSLLLFARPNDERFGFF